MLPGRGRRNRDESRQRKAWDEHITPRAHPPNRVVPVFRNAYSLHTPCGGKSEQAHSTRPRMADGVFALFLFALYRGEHFTFSFIRNFLRAELILYRMRATCVRPQDSRCISYRRVWPGPAGLLGDARR